MKAEAKYMLANANETVAAGKGEETQRIRQFLVEVLGMTESEVDDATSMLSGLIPFDDCTAFAELLG